MPAGGDSAITFAIPFHSGRAYLPRAIESVRAQRDGNWRAFVCDNASPEPGIEALVRSYRDGRIAYHRNAQNLGMAGNFNRCLELSHTELVTLLHADDELAPDYCGLMREAARRHPSAAALFCRALVVDEQGHPRFSLADAVKDLIHPSPRREAELHGEPAVRALLRGNFIVAPTLCFRKSVLGPRRFPEGFKFVLDLELTTGLLLDGQTLVALPEHAYRYRRHGENATSELTRTQLRYQEESDWFERMRAVAEARGWSRCARLAAGKRMLKLNLALDTLQRLARLELGDAGRALSTLRRL